MDGGLLQKGHYLLNYFHNTMKKAIVAGALYALPFLVFAQTSLEDTTKTVAKIIGLIVPIVGALLLIYFFWGIAQYVSAGGDEEKRGEARNMMIYAVIGMFVAFSIFGLVRLLRTTTGADDSSREPLPLFEGFKSKLNVP